MEQKEFWSLIEGSREYENQAEWLTEELVQRGLEQVVDFEFLFQSFMNASYTSRLWGAAYVVMGGCSDDAFDYFRGWLIGQREEVFHKVITNPEFLAEYINEDNLDDEGFPQNEELLAVGYEAYHLTKTGDTEWDDDVYDQLLQALEQKGLETTPDIEIDWEEDDLEEMFPLLWEKFGERLLGE